MAAIMLHCLLDCFVQNQIDCITVTLESTWHFGGTWLRLDRGNGAYMHCQVSRIEINRSKDYN